MNFTPAFETAVSHCMLYEVGLWFDQNDLETQQGLISTYAQRRKVGYVNILGDLGGETKYGVAKSSHPDLNIAALTWDQAKQIYWDEYWEAGNCDLFSADIVGVLHFDGCTNHGVPRASRFMQQILNSLPQDGVITYAVAALANVQDPHDVCRLLLDRRQKFYTDLVAARSDQAQFLPGWLSRINDMRAYCGV